MLMGSGLGERKMKSTKKIITEEWIGVRFGRWTTLEYRGKTYNGHHLYLCQCDCGIEKEVRFQALRGKISKGCGCHRRTKNFLYPPSQNKKAIVIKTGHIEKLKH